MAGKYSKDTLLPEGSRARYNTNYWERVNKIEYFRYLEGIGKISEEIGISISQLAIAWILKNPVVTAPIVGASTVEQVEENCRILEVKISDRDYQELNDLTKTCAASLY